MTQPESLAAVHRDLASRTDDRLAGRALRLVDSLRGHGIEASAPVALFAVPGRIELLGKHVDYAGGRSLTCAMDRGFLLAASPRREPFLTLLDAGRGDEIAVPIMPDLDPRLDHWSRYARAVARRLARDLPAAAQRAGVTVAFASDLPAAAGMSSSSAMVVAIWLVLAFAAEHAGAALPPALGCRAHLAGYLGAIEAGRAFALAATAGEATDGVGTEGGAQDHAAILCARAGHALAMRYAPERVERYLPLPRDHTLVIAASGVAAPKAAGAKDAFNHLARQAARLDAAWRAHSGSPQPMLASYLDGQVGRAGLVAAVAGDNDLTARLGALLAEVDDVRAAADALADGEVAAFGAFAHASQERAARVLRNQVPETVWLVRAARDLGAPAASSMGAGFGGAVWALVSREQAARFAAAWQASYDDAFPSRRDTHAFFTTEAGPPAQRLL